MKSSTVSPLCKNNNSNPNLKSALGEPKLLKNIRKATDDEKAEML